MNRAAHYKFTLQERKLAPAVQHYVDDAPTEQKVAALAQRTHTQARDVFDLDLLLRRRELPAGAVDSELLEAAVGNAMLLPFDAFRDQVLPFLEPDAAELYEGEGGVGVDADLRRRAAGGGAMKTTDAYSDLLGMERPVVTTPEASARWKTELRTTNRRLRALEEGGLVRRLRQGLWALDSRIPPFAAAPYLTAPYPAYVSLWSALAHHGLIEQIRGGSRSPPLPGPGR